jgi:hypothetical protein
MLLADPVERIHELNSKVWIEDSFLKFVPETLLATNGPEDRPQRGLLLCK